MVENAVLDRPDAVSAKRSMRPFALLAEARRIYDAPASPLPHLGARAWQGLFASGGEWMRQALEQLRGTPLVGSNLGANGLGFVKYGLASAAALLFVVAALLLGQPWWLVGIIPAFYAIEAQMVFLFPLVLDGDPTPFRTARRLTRETGGTLRVMWVVLPLAATMLFGGLCGRGFVRSWCLGCLAVCIWYEAVRNRRVAR